MTQAHDPLLTQEPAPTIVITCERRHVSGGTLGDFVLAPRVSSTNMPGGSMLEAWVNIHNILLQAVQIAQQQLVKEATKQGGDQIQVVAALPGDMVRH